MSKRQLIIAGIIGVLLLIGSVFVVFSPASQSNTPDGDYTDPALNQRAYISALKAHREDLDLNQIDAIQSTLYGVIAGNEESVKQSYLGVIRQGSYKINDEDPIKNISFIADIPDIKKSWRVEYYVNTQGSDGSTPVVVSCLETNEYIYDTFECKDLNDQ